MWKKFLTDELYYVKGLMTWKAFHDALVKYQGDMVEACFHFRIPSHGAPTPYNTHPWIANDWAVMHNGVIRELGDDQHTSDTERFSLAIQDIAYATMLKPDFQALLNIGSSRVVLMHTHQPTIILNEQYGVYRRPNVWFSNEYDNCVSHQHFVGAGVIEPRNKS